MSWCWGLIGVCGGCIPDDESYELTRKVRTRALENYIDANQKYKCAKTDYEKGYFLAISQHWHRITKKWNEELQLEENRTACWYCILPIDFISNLEDPPQVEMIVD